MPAAVAVAASQGRRNASQLARRRADMAEVLDRLDEANPIPELAALASGEPQAVQGPSGKVYRSTFFFCIRPFHEPRRTAIRICESRHFDPLILLTIMCNCVSMAWESPLDPCCTPKAQLIKVLEWIYLFIFTFELTVKIIAYGFAMHEGAYLRDVCSLDALHFLGAAPSGVVAACVKP